MGSAWNVVGSTARAGAKFTDFRRVSRAVFGAHAGPPTPER
jgi:hypothetical protein